MREIDVAHQPEDQGEAARHQEIEGGEREPVHEGEQEELHARRPVEVGVGLGVSGFGSSVRAVAFPFGKAVISPAI
jgi:hypothetical protein